MLNVAESVHTSQAAGRSICWYRFRHKGKKNSARVCLPPSNKIHCCCGLVDCLENVVLADEDTGTTDSNNASLSFFHLVLSGLVSFYVCFALRVHNSTKALERRKDPIIKRRNAPACFLTERSRRSLPPKFPKAVTVVVGLETNTLEACLSSVHNSRVQSTRGITVYLLCVGIPRCINTVSDLSLEVKNFEGGSWLRHHSLLRPGQALQSLNAAAAVAVVSASSPPFCRGPCRLLCSKEVIKKKQKTQDDIRSRREPLLKTISQQKTRDHVYNCLPTGYCFGLCTFRDILLRTSRLSPFLMLDDAGSTDTNVPPRRATAAWKEHAVLVEVS